MKLRALAAAGPALVLLLAVCAPTPAARSAERKPAAADPYATYGRRLPDPPASGNLPDSFVVARVGDRDIRVHQFVERYFNSYVEFRASEDSLGRVRFLNTMIHKELLGRAAREANRPFGFEDRLKLREYSDRVYSNVLYQRFVVEPVKVSEDDVRKNYEYYKNELRLRHILFADREVGERVRRELIAGRLRWSDAARRHSLALDREQDGDLGWQGVTQMGLELAAIANALKPGETSGLIQMRDGWNLFQCTDRRPVDPPAYDGIVSLIRNQLATIQSNNRADALQDSLALEAGVVLDTANVTWAAGQFRASSSVENPEGGAPTVNIDATVPVFTPADTARVLARSRTGRLTLGQFLHNYSAVTPLMRPNVNDFWLLGRQVVTTMIEPYIVQVAVARGMDRDPVAVHLVEQRREEIQVDHLFADSVESRVWVRPEERRRYYEEHKSDYVTYVKVRYATIVRHSRAGADSVLARLAAGEPAAAILRADSLAGVASGGIQERRENERGTPYYKVLFEELKPGQHTLDGPDRNGDYLVLTVLARDEARQLSFDESVQYVDESLQNLRAEELLNGLLARIKKRVRVDWRPDLVMRIPLVPPS